MYRAARRGIHTILAAGKQAIFRLGLPRFTPDTVGGMTTGKSKLHLNSVSELSVSTCQNSTVHNAACYNYYIIHTNTTQHSQP